LTKIRRQAVTANTAAPTPAPSSPAAPADARSFRIREALSLAATAAADKGVTLSREALEDYALSPRQAADPQEKDHSGGGAGEGSGNGGGGNAGGGPNGNSSGDTGGQAGGDPDGSPGGIGQKEGARRKAEDGSGKSADVSDVERLRDKVLEAERQNPLINLMNRLPGRNGQRWICIPFSFEDGGLTFNVTLRVLLAAEAHRAEQFALEISGEKQRWLFTAACRPGGTLHLEAGLWPAVAEKTLRSMEKELAALLAVPPEQVQVRNDEEFPPFAPDSRKNAPLPVDEEV
jgi:hypothetical protein